MTLQTLQKPVSIKERLLSPTATKKLIFFLLFDALIIVIALYSAFLLRFDFSITDPMYYQILYRAIPLFLAVKLLSFAYFRLYRLSWRYVSIKDFFSIVKAVTVSAVVLIAAIYFFRLSFLQGFPRSVVVSDALITLLFVACLRISKRLFFEVVRSAYAPKGRGTLIVGAGNTGEMILRDIQKTGLGGYAVVGFLDDDVNRLGMYLHGVKVVGRLEDLPFVIRNYRVSSVVIAIPGLGHVRLREMYTTAKEAGANEIKIVPRIYDIHRPELRARELEDIKVEDLIGRQSVAINYQEIGRSIEDKTVLVSGAGGSIGFELVRQLAGFNPRQLLLFEIDETELYHAEITLRREAPTIIGRIKLLVGDVRDRERVEKVFRAYRPDVVFHAAAYKHVPMMEYNADEAVKVNIFGTLNVVRAAQQYGTDRFVMISTDKAVRPTSIMGATKRIADFICRAYTSAGRTEYISVRFGNVLGSRGSVLPLFLDQIERGEPLTITHQDMRRYFMTIPEAVSLVLQASVIGRGGDTMVLDMGNPVKITELASELLHIHGLEPYKDVDLHFIGLRPGEKLFEEILTAEEGTVSTRHEKIFVAKTVEQYTLAQIEELVEQFRRLVLVGDMDGKEIKTLLRRYIRWYEQQPERLPETTVTNVLPSPNLMSTESRSNFFGVVDKSSSGKG
ncbi:polysaccharide biosynthesis protein [Candidatus Uhrbacteria bacterium]|nr:polysaccharide biosynthesis protein [Candidatus Uhrbacteria bacterium]